MKWPPLLRVSTWFALVVLLLAACSDSTDESGSTTLASTTTTEASTTGNQGATTTTGVVATTTATTTTAAAPEMDVAKDWLAAYAAGEFAKAETLSTAWAAQSTHEVNVTNQLDPGVFEIGLNDVTTTNDSVTWIYADRDDITYDNLVVVDGKVSDFDRNGAAVSTLVSVESGQPNEVAGVTVVVRVVHHEQDPQFGTVTFLTIEIDNQSDEEVYGWDAELVGSDRRAAEVAQAYNGSYAPGAISDDVLTFVGADLAEGGELRIHVNYDTAIPVEVPAVPSIAN